MTKRYFYRCPLAAAWQLKNHNILCHVNFIHPDGDNYLPCDEDTLLEIMKRGNHKFYVSQDSLPLLQPMVGDIGVENIESPYGQLCRFIDGTWVGDALAEEKHIFPDQDKITIIFRNNIAWIAPEVEEV